MGSGAHVLQMPGKASAVPVFAIDDYVLAYAHNAMARGRELNDWRPLAAAQLMAATVFSS